MEQAILEEIQCERLRQDLKFGAQPRSFKPTIYLTVLTEELGEVAGSIIECDSDNYRVELIQLAAVAVAAIQDFDLGSSTHQIESVCKPILYGKDWQNCCCEIAGDRAQFEYF
jgi:NTP pyrophosphatase (non-canonical NTP hydrolase)